jgi:hypothetical protein
MKDIIDNTLNLILVIDYYIVRGLRKFMYTTPPKVSLQQYINDEPTEVGKAKLWKVLWVE